MTAQEAPVLVRTRLAVDRAGGKRVVLPTDDVVELLRHAVGRAQAVDLDAAVPEQRSARDESPAKVVELGECRADGVRLARACWEAQTEGRAEPWRPWEDLDEGERSLLVALAVTAIRSLARSP